MIDLDAIVLGTCQTFYSRPITVTPLVSMPGADPYPARGIWRSKPVDVEMEGDSIMSSQVHTLDVRASEWPGEMPWPPDFLPDDPAPIKQGDEIEIDAHLSYPRVGVCLVEDVDDDGAGSLLITLKVIAP